MLLTCLIVVHLCRVTGCDNQLGNFGLKDLCVGVCCGRVRDNLSFNRSLHCTIVLVFLNVYRYFYCAMSLSEEKVGLRTHLQWWTVKRRQ